MLLFLAGGSYWRRPGCSVGRRYHHRNAGLVDLVSESPVIACFIQVDNLH